MCADLLPAIRGLSPTRCGRDFEPATDTCVTLFRVHLKAPFWEEQRGQVGQVSFLKRDLTDLTPFRPVRVMSPHNDARRSFMGEASALAPFFTWLTDALARSGWLVALLRIGDAPIVGSYEVASSLRITFGSSIEFGH